MHRTDQENDEIRYETKCISQKGLEDRKEKYITEQKGGREIIMSWNIRICIIVKGRWNGGKKRQSSLLYCDFIIPNETGRRFTNFCQNIKLNEDPKS